MNFDVITRHFFPPVYSAKQEKMIIVIEKLFILCSLLLLQSEEIRKRIEIMIDCEKLQLPKDDCEKIE